MRGWTIAAAAALVLVSVTGSAGAQTPPPGPVAELPQNTPRIKHHFTLMASGSLDLDVFGEVVTLGLSCNGENPEAPDACSRQRSLIQVQELKHYPDVYVALPKRWHASAGFGIFHKDELIVQVSGGRSTAEPDIRLGRFVSAAGDRAIRATFTTYKDQTIEGGLRHYFKNTGRSKSYVNLLFGRRTVEAISAELVAAGSDGNFGTVRFYDEASVRTAAIVFGVTYERGPAGIFIEGGFRWTAKLKQQDDDLGAMGVPMINDTHSRIFMPASFGLLLRF